MTNEQFVENQSAPEHVRTTDTDARTSTVKLVEIGNVSAETKGTVRGVEWGFTPHA